MTQIWLSIPTITHAGLVGMDSAERAARSSGMHMLNLVLLRETLTRLAWRSCRERSGTVSPRRSLFWVVRKMGMLKISPRFAVRDGVSGGFEGGNVILAASIFCVVDTLGLVR